MGATRDTSTDRRDLGAWIQRDDPRDAIFAYYMLYHPASRVRLHVIRDAEGRIRGALAECVTGYDLFRPLIVALSDDDNVLRQLLQEGMPRDRPVLLLAPIQYLPILTESLDVSEESAMRLYVLDRDRFRPIVNVLVTSSKSPDGLPLFQIRSRDRTRALATAGVNWQSPRFAEVHVSTAEEARGRRWGESVVSALCAELVKQGRTPLYLVSEDNHASQRLAERVGFRDTGRRLLFGSVSWSATNGEARP